MRNSIKSLWILTLLFTALYFIPVSGMLFFTTVLSFILIGYYGVFGFSIFTKVRKIFKKDSYKSISINSIIFAIILGLFFAILILFAQYRMRLIPYGQVWRGKTFGLTIGPTPAGFQSGFGTTYRPIRLNW